MINWIKSERIAIGQMITHQDDLSLLYSSGIEVIINLQEQSYEDQYDLSVFTYYHLPITDFSVPSSSTIDRFFRIIEKHQNQSIYVHCTAGCGRSGTMVALWLTTIQSWQTLDELVTYLRERRPCAIETDEQMQLVENYLNK